jgi:hypothetical protein
MRLSLSVERRSFPTLGFLSIDHASIIGDKGKGQRLEGVPLVAKRSEKSKLTQLRMPAHDLVSGSLLISLDCLEEGKEA